MTSALNFALVLIPDTNYLILITYTNKKQWLQ